MQQQLHKSLRFNAYFTVPILKGHRPFARVVLEKGKRTLTRRWRGRSWSGWWRSPPWSGSRRRPPPWSTSRSTSRPTWWLLSRRNQLRNIHFHIPYGVRWNHLTSMPCQTHMPYFKIIWSSHTHRFKIDILGWSWDSWGYPQTTWRHHGPYSLCLVSLSLMMFPDIHF